MLFRIFPSFYRHFWGSAKFRARQKSYVPLQEIGSCDDDFDILLCTKSQVVAFSNMLYVVENSCPILAVFGCPQLYSLKNLPRIRSRFLIRPSPFPVPIYLYYSLNSGIADFVSRYLASPGRNQYHLSIELGSLPQNKLEHSTWLLLDRANPFRL
jgi:hypothetical protein